MSIRGAPRCMQAYILADTTYNPLSVDEVAAAHVNADCVVRHMGIAATEGPACSIDSALAHEERDAHRTTFCSAPGMLPHRLPRLAPLTLLQPCPDRCTTVAPP